jgi:hypothetical protein
MTIGNMTIGVNTTLNTHTFNVTGNLAVNNTLQGTGTVVMSGSGMWSGIGITSIDLILNTVNTITVSGTVTFSGSKTLTYTAGTIITTGSTLRLRTCNLNTDGIIWNTITLNTSGQVITLLSNLRANTFLSGTNAHYTFNDNVFYLNTLNLGANTTTSLGGTSQIRLDGTGTISASHTTGRINSPLFFDTLGTITTAGNINIANLTYEAGTLDHTTSDIGILGTITSNAVGLHFQTLTIQGTSTFAGTGGFVIHTLVSAVGTHTYASGATYTILNTLQLLGTVVSPIVMNSSTPSSIANFVLAYSGTQTVGYVNATDIDSSLGQTIWDWAGVLSNTVNWNILTANVKEAYTFIN